MNLSDKKERTHFNTDLVKNFSDSSFLKSPYSPVHTIFYFLAAGGTVEIALPSPVHPWTIQTQLADCDLDTSSHQEKQRAGKTFISAGQHTPSQVVFLSLFCCHFSLPSKLSLQTHSSFCFVFSFCLHCSLSLHCPSLICSYIIPVCHVLSFVQHECALIPYTAMAHVYRLIGWYVNFWIGLEGLCKCLCRVKHGPACALICQTGMLVVCH